MKFPFFSVSYSVFNCFLVFVFIVIVYTHGDFFYLDSYTVHTTHFSKICRYITSFRVRSLRTQGTNEPT